tara:strand:- start:890 stop:1585 length:696 start_codon:yes stop_codon:yes gene_type:complete
MTRVIRLSTEDAWPLIEDVCGVPIKDYHEAHGLQYSQYSNKGGSGQLLEDMIGIGKSSDPIDLTDGEIKSYKKGQTIAISMITTHIHELVEQYSFKDSWIYNKIKQTIFVPRWEDKNNKDNTFFVKPFLWNEESYPNDFLKIEEDWDYLCEEVNKCYRSGNLMRTISGPNKYIQIRTKGSGGGKDKPISYNGSIISNQKRAIYFMNPHMGNYFFEKSEDIIEKTLSEVGWR